ncbi:MAG: serine/threonine kinase, partial [Cyanobacteriota bacterium]
MSALIEGKLIQDKYCILQTLGRNAFSETFLATDDSSFYSRRRYIIKKIRPILGNREVENIRRSFYQEARILKRLSGENRQIPRLYEYFMNGEDFYLVREWIAGLTLKQ